jgi:Recombinase
MTGKVGRPRTVPRDVVAAIKLARSDGFSYGKIANALNDEGVPTAQGGRRWWPATVRAIALQDP